MEQAACPVPTLHHLTSSQSLRVLWALEELAAQLQQPYRLRVYRRVRGRAPPELKRIFPLGKSPILEVTAGGEGADFHSGGSGNDNDNANDDEAGLDAIFPNSPTVITESRLILQYIAESYSRGIWTPRTAAERRRDVYWQEFSGSTLSPIVERILVFDLIPANTPVVARPLTWVIFHPFVALFKKDLVLPFELMENSLSDTCPWFAGRKLGLADFCLSWPLDLVSQRRYLDPARYPRLADWLRRIHAREAYQRAVDRSGSYDLNTFDM